MKIELGEKFAKAWSIGKDFNP